MKKVLIICNDSGGGHRTTANSLVAGLQDAGVNWNTKILSFYKDIIKNQDDAAYNFIARWGLNRIYWSLILPLFLFKVRLFSSIWARKTQNAILEYQPDAIISVIPLVNDVIKDAIDQSGLDIPLITIGTDMEDPRDNYWIQNKDQYFLCPSKQFYDKVAAFGVPDNKSFLLSDVIVRPEFYQQNDINLNIYTELGIDPSKPVGLVMFGGSGANAIYELAMLMRTQAMDSQFIFMCGNNQNVFDKISKLNEKRFFPLGFRKDIHQLFKISNFVIGKSGSGFICEALTLKKPIITLLNKHTFRQEVPPAKLVKDRSYGFTADNITHIPVLTEKLLDQETYGKLKSNLNNYHSNGLNESVEILRDIIDNEMDNKQQAVG